MRNPAQEERGERRRAALTMYSPLSAILRREPTTVPLEATVREVLETMEQMNLGSIIVADPGSRVPLGIFTRQDLLRRVTLPGTDLQQPIALVMTSGLITLGPQATAHQAALTMARHRVGHVLVVDGEGRLLGEVSQDDLFGLQQVGVKDVSNEIGGARDLDDLRSAATGIRRLAADFLAQGIATETLSHFTSTLNDLLTIRIIDLTAEEHDLPPVPICWIALGSEGRLEQTFATDQDNGIIFEGDEADADAIRQGLIPFARVVNQKLDACGFPLCKGNFMAGNPQWCLPLEEWQRTFSRWIQAPLPEAILHASVFSDLRPIHGREALAERLRDALLSTAAEHPLFLRHLAADALRFRPPLGTLRDFVYGRSKEYPHTIDLKMYGSRIFVDAARVLSLQHQVRHTSTAERLRALAEAVSFEPGDLAAMIDGFHFLHLVRLRNQCRPGNTGEGANRVDPRDLNDLDRGVLKAALKQARNLQERLALDFSL